VRDVIGTDRTLQCTVGSEGDTRQKKQEGHLLGSLLHSSKIKTVKLFLVHGGEWMVAMLFSTRNKCTSISPSVRPLFVSNGSDTAREVACESPLQGIVLL